ncbi:MAG: VWA domain-containing protein [Thermoanaerobaculia bacterium]
MREQLHPSDLVGVATYSRSEGIRVPLGFTSDRRQVEVAIDSLGLPQMVEAVRDPLGLVLADEANFRNIGGGSGGGGGGGGAAGARAGVDPGAEIKQLLESMETQDIRTQSRNDILSLTSSLAGLADVMAGVEGRKHLVYLSEGFDTSAVFGRGRGETLEEQRKIQETNEAAMRGEVWNVNSEERFGSTSTQNELTQALQELVRSGVTVQAVDIRGLGEATDSAAEGRAEDGLFMLAEETGGELLKDFNNLSDAMGEVLERTSVTYLLAFEPGDVKPDGAYHEIKVKLKDGGRGVRVEHRPGYFAPEPYAQQAGLQRRFNTAESILSGREAGDIAASLLSAAFPMSGERSYVPVLVEIDGPSLLAGLQQDTAPTEIYGYAIGADGAVKDFFTQLLNLDVGKVGDALRRSGFKYWAHMELPPGDYSIRVVVRNGATGASAVKVAEVEVPDASQSLLLPPFVPEPQGKWLLGREPMPDGKDYPYPFMLGSDAIIPAAKPRFAPNSQERIALAGYGLGGGDLGVRAELRGGDGQAADGVELQLDARSEDGGFERLTGTLVVGAVPAGEYDLVVSVRDEGTGEVRSSRVPVTVG